MRSSWAPDNSEPFLGRDFGHQRDYSEDIAAIVDEEVSKLIGNAHQEAFDILTENRDVLDSLVRALFEKETLDRAEVAAVFEPLRLRPKRPAWTGSDKRVPSTIPPVTPPPPSLNGRNGHSQRNGYGNGHGPLPPGETPGRGSGVAAGSHPRSADAAGAARGRLGSVGPAAAGSGGPTGHGLARPAARPGPRTGRPRGPTTGDAPDGPLGPDWIPVVEPAPAGEFDHARVAAAVREILYGIGEDPDRDGLRDTPDRVARAYAEMFAGLRQESETVLATTFDLGHDELVLVKDIEVWSCCEHHLVPFTGVAHVGYIPNDGGQITGLSKLARLVDLYAKRPQVQERLTTQIADALQRILQPRGVIVVIECEHLCMTMRGVRKPGSKTITSAVRGQLRDPATRAEAMTPHRRPLSPALGPSAPSIQTSRQVPAFAPIAAGANARNGREVGSGAATGRSGERAQHAVADDGWSQQVRRRPASDLETEIAQHVLAALLVIDHVPGRLPGPHQLAVLDQPVVLAERPLLLPTEVGPREDRPRHRVDDLVLGRPAVAARPGGSAAGCGTLRPIRLGHRRSSPRIAAARCRADRGPGSPGHPAATAAVPAEALRRRRRSPDPGPPSARGRPPSAPAT